MVTILVFEIALMSFYLVISIVLYNRSRDTGERTDKVLFVLSLYSLAVYIISEATEMLGLTIPLGLHTVFDYGY
jgi:hypothetical protein